MTERSRRGIAVDGMTAKECEALEKSYSPRNLRDFYTLGESIHKTGIWKAWAKSDGHPVAIKILSYDEEQLYGLGRQIDYIRVSILREMDHTMKTIATLNCPYIASYEECVYDETMGIGVVMEWCERGSLFDNMQGYKHNAELVSGAGIQIALALHALHSAGMVYRDLKMENILVRSSDIGGTDQKKHPSLALADFGIMASAEYLSIAKTKKSFALPVVTGQEFGLWDERATPTDRFIGTPGYFSPEQIGGHEHMTASSDLFTLGVVLAELYEMRSVFEGKSVRKIINNNYKADMAYDLFDLVHERNKNGSASKEDLAVADIISSLMHRNINDRGKRNFGTSIENAKDVASALANVWKDVANTNIKNTHFFHDALSSDAE